MPAAGQAGTIPRSQLIRWDNCQQPCTIQRHGSQPRTCATTCGRGRGGHGVTRSPLLWAGDAGRRAGRFYGRGLGGLFKIRMIVVVPRPVIFWIRAKLSPAAAASRTASSRLPLSQWRSVSAALACSVERSIRRTVLPPGRHALPPGFKLSRYRAGACHALTGKNNARLGTASLSLGQPEGDEGERIRVTRTFQRMTPSTKSNMPRG